MTRRTRLLLVALACLPVPAGAQERAADPERQIAGYERYLERKPYHDWALDKLVEVAVSAGRLDALVDGWRARLAESPTDEAARVVLARLCAASDRDEEALELLLALPAPVAETHRLVARLETRRGNAAAAAEALGRAVAAADDPALLETLHGEHASALLAAGDRDGAVAAFRALAELRPDSFHLRVEAAAQLADHGLLDEAAAVLEEAKTLAADDAEKRSRVLSELAKVHERRGAVPAATEAYFEAFGLLARGHWMRSELVPRLLAMARRSGTLDALLERCAAAAADRGDLAARELHAEVLDGAARRAEARAVLTAAIADHPSDLDLSRALLASLAADGDDEARVAELQRILAEHPGELELYVELGQALAAGGHLEAARLQWQRTLEQRMDDANLASRLGELFARNDQVDDAVDMLERAVALEPRDLRRYGDLARLLTAHDRADAALEALERAQAVAQGDAGRLDELAGLWNEAGRDDRARAALEAALALTPDDAPRLARLAELHRLAGDTATAGRLLRRVLEVSDEASLRKSALDQLVRQAERDGTLEALVADARGELAADDPPPAAALVAARGLERLRKPGEAEEVLTALVARHPELEEANFSLARLLEQDGAAEEALARYAALLEAHPSLRRRVLKDMARLHLALEQPERAVACYEEILAAAPENPAAWLEVASAYEGLLRSDEALRCVRQAVRLAPDDGTARLRLAQLLKDRGEWERAEDEILAVATATDPDERARARARHYDMLREVGLVRARMEELRVRVQENPYDVESSLTLSDLYSRELEHELALQTVERLVTYQPHDARLAAERARLLEGMERWDEARAVREDLFALPDVDPAQAALDLARVSLELGDPARARELLATVRDPRRVAALFQRYDLWSDAERTLSQGLTGGPGDEPLLLSLSRLHEQRREWTAGAEALERVVALRGDSWMLTTRLGELWQKAGERDRTLAAGRRLIELFRVPEEELDAEGRALSSPQRRSYWEIQRWFEEQNLQDDFVDLILAEARTCPRDQTVVDAAFRALSGDAARAGDALGLLDVVRAATAERRPAGMGPTEWSERLWGYELRTLQKDRALAQAAADARAARLAAKGAAAPDELWVQQSAILRALQDDDGAKAVLDRGRELRPDSARLHAAAAVLALDRERWADAERALRALLPRVAGVTEVEQDEEVRARSAAREAQSLRGMLRAFPRDLRRGIDDDALRAMKELASSKRWTLNSGPWSTPTEPAAKLALARALAEEGRTAEARTAFQELAEDATNRAADHAALARTLESVGLDDLAEGELRRFFDVFDALEADPIQRYGHGLERYASEAGALLAKLREAAGDPVEAYTLLRQWGDRGSAMLLLDTAGAHEAVLARLRERADRTEDPIEARNARVQAAEVLAAAKRWDEALAVYEALATERPDDTEVLENVALLHERAGRWRAAIEAQWRVVEAKRAHNQRLARGEPVETRLLDPLEPNLPQSENDWDWNNLRNATRVYGPASRFAPSGQLDLAGSYASILKLLLDHRQVGEATDVLRELATSSPRSYGWISSSLASIVQRYAMGAEGLPMLAFLVRSAPTDESTLYAYGEALMESGKLEDAERTFRRLASDPATQQYYVDRARERMHTITGRRGAALDLGLDDLRAAVAADPANVQKRMDLIATLKTERLWVEALEHATAAAEAAPHRDDVQDELEGLLTRLGRDEELERLLDARLERASNPDARLRIGLRMAGWAWARGDVQATEALLERTFDERVSESYSPAGWWLKRGETGRAIAALRADLERVEDYRKDGVRRDLAALASSVDDVLPVLANMRDALGREQRQAAVPSAVGRYVQLYESLQDLEQRGDSRMAELTARGQLLDACEAAAIEICLGRLPEAEARLAAAARADEREGVYLTPTRVRLARARGDRETAIDLLQELVDGGRLGHGSAVYVDRTSWSEHDLALAEIGLLRAESGDEAGARSAFEALEDVDDDSRPMRLAQLYREAGWYAEALAQVDAFLDGPGARDEGALSLRVELLEALGRWSDVPEMLQKLLLLRGEDENQRSALRGRILAAHRRAGTLTQHREALRGAAARDPDDLEVVRELAQVEGELGDAAEQRALLERMADVPALADRVLPTLIEDAKRERDLERVRALYARRLAGTAQEWEKEQTRQQCISLLAHHGLRDEVLALAVEPHPDPASVEHHLARARALQALDAPEEALAEFEAALAIEPGSVPAGAGRSACWTKLERWDAVLSNARSTMHDPKRRESVGSLLTSKALAEGRGEALVKELSESEDPLDAWLAGRVHLISNRPAEAVPLLERARAELPEEIALGEALVRAYRGLERWSDALRVVEADLPLRERVGAVESSWRYRPDEARRERGELLLLLGDRAGAVRAWGDRLGLRHQQVETYGMSHGNLQGTRRMRGSSLLSELVAHEMWEEAAEALPPADSARTNLDPTRFTVLVRTGRADQALEELWERVVPPPSAPFVEDERRTFYGDLGSYLSSGAPGPLILEVARMVGRVDEEVDRLLGVLDTWGPSEERVFLRRAALAAGERWSLLAEDLEQQLEQADGSEPEESQLVECARAHEKAGAHARALELYERAAALARGAASAAEQTFWSSASYQRASRQPTRFRFAVQNRFGGGSTRYGSSRRIDELRSERAGLLLLLGRRDEALALEREELDAMGDAQWAGARRVGSSFVQRYLALSLWDDALRFRERAFELNLAAEEDEGRREALRTEFLVGTIGILRKAGREDGIGSLVQEVQTRTAKQLEAAETDQGRRSTALLAAEGLREAPGDARDALAWLEQTGVLANGEPEPLLLRAEALLQAGDPDGALRELAALRKHEPWKRLTRPVAERIPLALAEAAVGRPDVQLLQSCLLDAPDDPRAAELRKALEDAR